MDKPRITMKMNLAPLKKLAKKSPEAFRKAQTVAAIQFLTWANKGSKDETRTPPIRWGVLRGSSSAFVGNKLVLVYPISLLAGAPERATPAKNHTAPKTTITWSWNTSYAWKMHEWKVPPHSWGKFTLQATDAGNKWLEKHLRKDRNALMEMIRDEVKRGTGM